MPERANGRDSTDRRTMFGIFRCSCGKSLTNLNVTNLLNNQFALFLVILTVDTPPPSHHILTAAPTHLNCLLTVTIIKLFCFLIFVYKWNLLYLRKYHSYFFEEHRDEFHFLVKVQDDFGAKFGLPSRCLPVSLSLEVWATLLSICPLKTTFSLGSFHMCW